MFSFRKALLNVSCLSSSESYIFDYVKYYVNWCWNVRLTLQFLPRDARAERGNETACRPSVRL